MARLTSARRMGLTVQADWIVGHEMNSGALRRVLADWRVVVTDFCRTSHLGALSVTHLLTPQSARVRPAARRLVFRGRRQRREHSV